MTTEVLARDRHIGLFGATSIGVGAIVGGGILALTGTAFAVSGPSALLAFSLNGVIAVISALSFAELSSAYPQSGGTYSFAKRVLGVGAAFNIGWVVWFASIVATSLYAMGFAAFALGTLSALAPAGGAAWLAAPWLVTVLAVLATAWGTWSLARSPGSGGNWVNVLKVVVFGVLIAGGAWVWFRTQPPAMDRLTPFFPHGANGLLQAMGYTFIALQGFDLIAAGAGEVKDPRRVLPRAMLGSLAIAIVVYLPLLLVVLVVGVPSAGGLSALLDGNPDTIVADAARIFLGAFGFWLVMAAGVLSMHSAMMANLFAASRIAQAMARDRTLPAALERTSPLRGTPVTALWTTAGVSCVILVLVGDVGNAGAASSLSFLITFAMTHAICVLARIRSPNHGGFRTPWWPTLPIVGGVACTALACFQGVAVPAAGLITGGWLVVGFFCYVWLFGHRARIHDAASEAADPDLLELRGRSPLVLVPIANPANAVTLAHLAACISPPRVGRVLLLNVIRMPCAEPERPAISGLAAVLEPSLDACLRAGVRVEGLATVSDDPWTEIERVTRAHRCASVLMGMNNLDAPAMRERLGSLARRLTASCVILQAPPGWRLEAVRRIVIPIGGRGTNHALRARLLAGLVQRADAALQIRYLTILPSTADEAQRTRMERNLPHLLADEVSRRSGVEVVISDDPAGAIAAAAKEADLLLLGLNQVDERQPVFGPLVTSVIAANPCPIMVIGHRN